MAESRLGIDTDGGRGEVMVLKVRGLFLEVRIVFWNYW